MNKKKTHNRTACYEQKVQSQVLDIERQKNNYENDCVVVKSKRCKRSEAKESDGPW